MDIRFLVECAKEILSEQPHDGEWAGKVCRLTSEVLEAVKEGQLKADAVEGQVVPIIDQLLDEMRLIKPTPSFSQYLPGYIENVAWRVSELKLYADQERKEPMDCIFARMTDPQE